LNHLFFIGSFSVVCSFIGYQTRGAAPSNFDVNYAYNLGFAATRLIIDGYSGYMATIGSLREKVENWQPAGVPITALMAWYVQHIAHTKHYPHSTPKPIRDN
jgi:6-phosphofructokinase